MRFFYFYQLANALKFSLLGLKRWLLDYDKKHLSESARPDRVMQQKFG